MDTKGVVEGVMRSYITFSTVKGHHFTRLVVATVRRRKL